MMRLFYREITATEYSTELVTETQAPALGPVQPQILENILPELIQNIPELAQLAVLQQQQAPASFEYDYDLQYDDIESLLLNPELLEALQNDPEIASFQNNENLHEERIIQTEVPQVCWQEKNVKLRRRKIILNKYFRLKFLVSFLSQQSSSQAGIPGNSPG